MVPVPSSLVPTCYALFQMCRARLMNVACVCALRLLLNPASHAAAHSVQVLATTTGPTGFWLEPQQGSSSSWATQKPG